MTTAELGRQSPCVFPPQASGSGFAQAPGIHLWSKLFGRLNGLRTETPPQWNLPTLSIQQTSFHGKLPHSRGVLMSAILSFAQ